MGVENNWAGNPACMRNHCDVFVDAIIIYSIALGEEKNISMISECFCATAASPSNQSMYHGSLPIECVCEFAQYATL